MVNWFSTNMLRQLNRERIVFQQMVLEQQDIYICKRMKLDPFFRSYTKVNLKWIIDWLLELKTIKHWEENIGINVCDLGLGKVFLDTTPKSKRHPKTCCLPLLRNDFMNLNSNFTSFISEDCLSSTEQKD